MFQVVQGFIDGLLGNVIGGGAAQAGMLGMLALLMILALVLIMARLGFEVAMIIVAPGVILASFAGIIPPLSFGLWVVMLGIFWAGLILALVR